jgi:hypothetical protein
VDAQTLRDYATDAIRYWEPRRLAYNAVLAAIVLIYFRLGYPASKTALSLNTVSFLFLMAVLANVAYCAAYIVDIFAQATAFQEGWRRYRWILFTVGLLFAAVLTRFWALGLFLNASG